MRVVRLFLIITTSIVYISCAQEKSTQQKQVEIVSVQVPQGLEVATFAGGCFWCTEAIFERVKGVTSSISGYAGGKEANPTYQEVSYGKTSHAEAVQILYDPKIISYSKLLEIFFATHDPTQLNRQGPDVGRQYRSAVYFHSDKQKKELADYVSKLEKSGQYSKKIVTEQTAYTNFYEAEGYHQDYYEINPRQPYVYNVSRPKVLKLLKLFPEYLKEKYQ